MARDLTDEDVDKPVVTPEGAPIGTLSDVRDGRGRVTPDDDSESLTDEIKSMLGWDDSDDSDGTHELRNDDIDSVTDDEVRLRSHR